jgi:hypothetical protein
MTQARCVKTLSCSRWRAEAEATSGRADHPALLVDRAFGLGQQAGGLVLTDVFDKPAAAGLESRRPAEPHVRVPVTLGGQVGAEHESGDHLRVRPPVASLAGRGDHPGDVYARDVLRAWLRALVAPTAENSPEEAHPDQDRRLPTPRGPAAV